jgi:hypothetical protein
MRTYSLRIAVTLLLTVVLLGVAAPAVRADLMIIGLDEKVTFDRHVSILEVDGTKIADTGKKLALPGQPASMRGRNP